MATNGFFYMKGYYYMTKHEVFQELGYECQICGEEDPKALVIHHEDDIIHHGKPGLNRFIEARKKLNNGGGKELELLCEECHKVLHRAKDREEAEAMIFADDWSDLEYNGYSGEIEKIEERQVIP